MPSSYTECPVSPARRAVAARVALVKQAIPHFRVVREVNVEQVIRVQASLRRKAAGVKITLTDLFIKACAHALIEVPEVNAQWAETAVYQYAGADIAVAINTKSCVQTPIVWSADRKCVGEISRNLISLKERAERNQLKVADIVGGSFTVSNLGMYGVDQFDAIVNSPQCAILAVGAAKRKAWVTPADTVEPATVVKMTLCVDHRVIDGSLAAHFLGVLGRRLEQWSEADCGEGGSEMSSNE